jgi:hypothetical protein
MTFRELLRDPLLQTPKSTIYKGDFHSYLTETFEKFSGKVDKLDIDEEITIPGVRYKPLYIKEIVNILIDGIQQTVLLYLDGKINEAYNHLSSTLNHERKRFYEIINQLNIDHQKNFYRIRRQRNNTLFTPQELFHIPFELRGCVRNQRFSINGFPSLYVSSNLYTCWEELHRPDLNNFQAMRLRNIVELNVLDLTPPLIPRIIDRNHYRYLLIWPIIFACSIRVQKPDDIFKPEYIIPQLLLQWVRQNDNIDCIRYYSTNIDRYNSASKGDFSNYVFPVKTNAKLGYCAELQSLFRHTQPISWQAYQMATGGQSFIYSKEEMKKIDEKIPNLELIKNKPYPYSYSVLGKLEYYLDKMILIDADF